MILYRVHEAIGEKKWFIPKKLWELIISDAI